MSAAVLLLVTLGWLLVPGTLLGAAVGLRGWLLAAAAPALTMGVIAAAALGFAGIGLTWRPATVAVTCVLAAAAVAVPVLALTRPWRDREPRDPLVRWHWWQHAGIGAVLLVAGAVGVRSTYRATGGFDDVNQTWDAFFHAGAIRLIAENGDPSPASLAAIAAPASTDYFAPDSYHATAALIYQWTDASIIEVINVLAAVLPLLLGLGLIGLFRVTTQRPAHAVVVALFSAGVAAVPYHMIGYGTLLPYGTTLVMLPGVVALVAALLRSPGWQLGAVLGVAVAGLLNAHPQVAFLAGIVAAMQVAWHVAATRRISGRLLGAAGLGLALLAVIGGPVLLSSLGAASGAEAIDWPAYTSPGGAVGDLLLFNAASPFPQWWFVPPLVVGLVVVLARGPEAVLRPFVAAAAVMVGLYVLAGAYDGSLSLRVTSLWWNDRHRLAASFAVLAMVFCAVGAVWLRDRVTATALFARLPAPRRVGTVGLLAVGLLGFFVVTGGDYGPATRAALAAGYGPGPTLGDDERAGLAEVAQRVRAGGDGLVMNDPHDGCGWGYALYGTKMVFPTPLTGPFDWSMMGLDRERLYEDFDRIDDDSQVRRDADELDVHWAVTCTGFIRTWQERAPGLDDLDDVRSAELVYSNGSVRLYRLDEPPDD